MKVRIVEEAWQDLEDIAIWVARDSPQAAFRLYDSLVDAAEDLVPMPTRFPVLDGFESLKLRRRSMPPYSIVFRVEGEQWVSVLRVLHEARDFSRLFNS